MTKNEKIFKLFSNNFQCDDFRKNGQALGFSCPHEKECNVNKHDQPIWSAAVGDENTSVMIVGEAPSKTGGPGPHIGGLLANWEVDKRSPVGSQRSFVQEYYHTIPYFTDLAKCGVVRQQDKKALKHRIIKCIEYLLWLWKAINNGLKTEQEGTVYSIFIAFRSFIVTTCKNM